MRTKAANPSKFEKGIRVPEALCAYNLTTQSFLGMNVSRADTMWSRLRGLLGRRRLQADEGMWMVPSQGVHTIGLLFAIDIIYLDAEMRVIHLIEHLSPFRIAPVKTGAQTVLELPVRTIYASRTKLGDKLLICEPDRMDVCVAQAV
jgi:uncharacterized membrane protein (UPF0127 family)